MKNSTYRGMMMLGLYLCVAVFFFAIVVLIKNAEEIRTDPLVYGMKKHKLNSCTCYMDDGKMVNIELTDDKNNESNLYQGPVPLGYDEQHFRETGELKLEGVDKNRTNRDN